MRISNGKKTLVLGIIVLFVSVAVQPAFANEVSITKTSEVEEDCNCNPISNLHLVRLKRLVNRLEVYTNIISLFSKYNPEFAEKYQEISNRISTLKETNNELKLSLDLEFPIICAYLEIKVLTYYGLFFFYIYLYWIFYNYPKLRDIAEKFYEKAFKYLNLTYEIEYLLWYEYECYGTPEDYSLYYEADLHFMNSPLYIYQYTKAKK